MKSFLVFFSLGMVMSGALAILRPIVSGMSDQGWVCVWMLLFFSGVVLGLLAKK